MAHRIVGVVDGSLQIKEGKAHGDDPAPSCFWLFNGTECTAKRKKNCEEK